MARTSDKPRADDPRVETAVETNTVLEDRTETPAEDRVVEYDAVDVEITPGTIRTTYGEPVGGRPGEDAEVE